MIENLRFRIDNLCLKKTLWIFRRHCSCSGKGTNMFQIPIAINGGREISHHMHKLTKMYTAKRDVKQVDLLLVDLFDPKETLEGTIKERC